jgi:methylated-DNA-[protein]-cysteine S-methyltransferase
MIYSCTIGTPLGVITVSAENEAITGLWFIGQKYFPAKIDTWIDKPEYPVFKLLRTGLSDYFSGMDRALNLQLEPQGTPFQKAVWDILLKIPFGQITTYGEIARKIAAIRGLSAISAQAVGGAVGHNPISILIPCHRVVGSNGNLTGYAGGLDKKKALLQLEHVNMAKVKLN